MVLIPERNEIPCVGGAGKGRPFGESLGVSRSSSTSTGAVTINCESESEERISDSVSIDKLGDSVELSANSPLSAIADALDVDSMVNVKTLFEGRVHLGHKHGCWNPIVKPYIFGRLHDMHIFDLDKTLTHLKLALKVAGMIAYKGGIILFVNERTQFDRLIQHTARESKEYFFSPTWYPGIFTNSFMLLKTMKLPDLVIFLSAHASQNAIREVAMCNIPSIGIVDSDCNPNLITYPIPGNDDSPVSVRLYCKLFGEVISKAKLLKQATTESQKYPTEPKAKTASLLK